MRCHAIGHEQCAGMEDVLQRIQGISLSRDCTAVHGQKNYCRTRPKNTLQHTAKQRLTADMRQVRSGLLKDLA